MSKYIMYCIYLHMYLCHACCCCCCFVCCFVSYALPSLLSLEAFSLSLRYPLSVFVTWVAVGKDPVSAVGQTAGGKRILSEPVHLAASIHSSVGFRLLIGIWMLGDCPPRLWSKYNNHTMIRFQSHQSQPRFLLLTSSCTCTSMSCVCIH